MKQSSRLNITENNCPYMSRHINAAAVLPRMPSSFAQSFAGGVWGACSSPHNEPSTAGCRCHQCTRRTHSLLKYEITILALLFHRSQYDYGIPLTVINVFQICRFLFYVVIKGLILFQDPKCIQWCGASFLSHEIEIIWIPTPFWRIYWIYHQKLSQLQAFWYRVIKLYWFWFVD